MNGPDRPPAQVTGDLAQVPGTGPLTGTVTAQRAVTPREVAAWRDHLAEEGNLGRDGTTTAIAPATVNNHLAHLSALSSWITVHAPAGLLQRLYVSIKTVEFHLGHIFGELGIRSRKDLIARISAPHPQPET